MATEIVKGQPYIINADQWHENGYFFEDNLVYSYFTDRKDPQYCTDKGKSIEDFLADPNVESGAKAWLVGLLKDFPEISY